MLLTAKKLLAICLICILLTACTSNEAGVGVIVNKPTPPSENFFPDIDSYIPATALDNSAAASLSLTQKTGALTRVTPRQSVTLTGDVTLQDVWNSVFVDSGVAEAETFFEQMLIFGAAAATASSGITLDETVQTVTLGEATRLVNVLSLWQIQMRSDPTDASLARYTFIKSETSVTHGLYILQTSDAGEAVRGLLVFFNPELFASDAGDGVRLFALAFDFSNVARSILTLREDRYFPSTNDYFVTSLHMQCSGTACFGEHQEIISAPPTRTLDPFSVRFSWDESTGEVCLAQTDYSSGSLEIGTTYQFVSPLTADNTNVQSGVCSLATTTSDGTSTPLWGNHVFTEADLAMRYNDSTPAGGTASAYMNDLDAITPDLIDTWIDASGF